MAIGLNAGLADVARGSAVPVSGGGVWVDQVVHAAQDLVGLEWGAPDSAVGDRAASGDLTVVPNEIPSTRHAQVQSEPTETRKVLGMVRVVRANTGVVRAAPVGLMPIVPIIPNTVAWIRMARTTVVLATVNTMDIDVPVPMLNTQDMLVNIARCTTETVMIMPVVIMPTEIR